MSNLAAILISITSLLISAYLFWKQHLKPFRLWCRFQSSIFDSLGTRDNWFHIVLPITLVNEGARPGVITSWAVFLRKMDKPKEVFVFHGAGSVNVPTLIDALGKGNITSAKILQEGNPVMRLGGGERRDIGIVFVAPEAGGYIKTESQGFSPTVQLTAGKYNLELWCFVKKWARYHKTGLDLNNDKMITLNKTGGFINNSVPEFDLLKPNLEPNPRGK